MNLYVLKTWLKARYTNTERGASMVEYVLLVALIALVAIGAVTLLGQGTSTKFNDAKNSLTPGT